MNRLLVPLVCLLLVPAFLVTPPGADAQLEPTLPDDTWFIDVTRDAGLDFARQAVNNWWKLENVYEGGVGVADYDGDGWEDLYFTQTSQFPEGPLADLTGTGNRLFRNMGDGTFTDVTAAAGLDTRRMSHAAVWADYDNDGDPDLYVTNYGPNELWRNNGDGTFTDVTADAGVAGDLCYAPCWSSGAVWADIDDDGWLDLYVMTFRQQGRTDTPHDPQPHEGGGAAYGMRNLLFVANGDGTFSEIAAEAGVTDPEAEGWQPAFADIDHDGDLDLFLANDVTHNRFYLNNGDRTFTDVTDAAGVPYGFTSMGLIWADMDNDLDFDIIATEFKTVPTTYLINNGDVTFTDLSGTRGLEKPIQVTGWGVNAFDFDYDMDLDLFLANGDTNALDPDDKGNNFYLNDGAGWFDDRTDEAGVWGGTYARGSATFDYDRDGDDDLVISSMNGPAILWENRVDKLGNAFQIRFEGSTFNRDAVGTEFIVETPERRQLRQVVAGDSFESTNSPWQTVGIGTATSADVHVRWPDGTTQTVTVEAGQRWWIREGEGVVAALSSPFLPR